jgi:formate dehydrogenase family accessory protein FdhD
MGEAIRRVEIVRAYANGTFERRPDEVLEESPLVLELDGREEAAVILTPGCEKEWALGHLACRRMILSMEDVATVSVEPGKVRVDRKVARVGIPLKTRVLHTASTRMVDDARVRENWPDALAVEWNVPFETLQAAIVELAEAPLFRRTGSVHVAVLGSVSGHALFRVEDVGRHNAVDKAVGWALLEGIDLAGCYLAVSGRLPADMVYKAIGARIPILASVSAATAGGVDAARRGGITLIGFAREGRMNIYSVPERVSGSGGF